MNNEVVEELVKNYKEVINSKEYITGRTVLKFKYYLKRLKFITLIKLVINSFFKKKYVFKRDNNSNKELFVDNEKNTLKIYDNSKIAVYTVIIGNYDNLIQPLYKSDNIDYYVISDHKINNLGKWKWIDAKKYLPNYQLTNVKKARFLKTHPHLIFPNYKYSIFIDGNISVVSNIEELITKINVNTGIAIHLHPLRDCIYKEAIACKYTKKGNYKIIKNQMNTYRSLGMPSNFGLFETAVVAREHNNKVCIDIMEEWWNEIYNVSERDQLSFTYVLWKKGFTANDVGVLFESITANPKILLINHIQIYNK